MGCEGIQVGKSVPDFELAVYDASKDDFDNFSFADNKSKGRWTILFFYPADFTFV